LYAHMNNKRKMKKKKGWGGSKQWVSTEAHICHPRYMGKHK
jgi:hypothetical protein